MGSIKILEDGVLIGQCKFSSLVGESSSFVLKRTDITLDAKKVG